MSQYWQGERHHWHAGHEPRGYHHHRLHVTHGAHEGGVNGGFIGKGECTELVQHYAHVGPTPYWRAGESLAHHPDLAPGTPIATFDKNGCYPGHGYIHKHAALFERWGEVNGVKGAWILDQWNGLWTKNKIPHPPQERFISEKGSDLNNPNSFSVINSIGESLRNHLHGVGEAMENGLGSVVKTMAHYGDTRPTITHDWRHGGRG